VGAPEWWTAFAADMKAGRYFETRISQRALMFFSVGLDLERLKQFDEKTRADIRPLAARTDRRRRGQIEEFRRNGPHVRIIEMSRTAHYCFVHRPQEVIRAMRDFLLRGTSQRAERTTSLRSLGAAENGRAKAGRSVRLTPPPIGSISPWRRDMRIRQSGERDLPLIYAVINDAAQAYRGVIPADRWHEPYMPEDELKREIADGVVFSVAEEDGRLLGVIGVQDKGPVALVRHAYVVTTTQRQGVGTQLLRHVVSITDKPILIGTWADASWAIDFYCRNGFTVVPESHKDRLLRTYWSIPERQIETSVVLADKRWIEGQRTHG
jgi:GNAT superfamily N-acetyltransferase